MHELPVTRVAVYVFRRAPRVQLLQLRRVTVDDAHPRTWQPVYGGVEAGESAVEAALRELKEETGLHPLSFFQVEFLESCYFRPRDSILLMPVFGAEVAPEAAVALDAEHDAHRWVSHEAVSSAFMWRSQREAVAVLLDQLERNGPAHDALRIQLPD